MAELKTKPTTKSVAAFIKSLPEERRADCQELVKIMERATGKRAKMWGSSIVGFDTYHYKYASGREGDWMATGFSPRKQNLTIYIMPGFARYKDILKRIGRHKTAKSCLYVKQLADLDKKLLEKMVKQSVKDIKKIYS